MRHMGCLSPCSCLFFTPALLHGHQLIFPTSSSAWLREESFFPATLLEHLLHYMQVVIWGPDRLEGLAEGFYSPARLC